jgi:hypothetical protein
MLAIGISLVVPPGKTTDQPAANKTQQPSERLHGFRECATDVRIRFRVATSRKKSPLEAWLDMQ